MELDSNNANTTFLTGDTVAFDDRAIPFSGTAPVVNINGADVNPAVVTFSNTAASYTLQGSNAVAGNATLVVNGAGLVTIANNNSYTGATTISSGTLQLVDGGSIDGTSGVTNNSVLVYNATGSLTASYSIAGSGSVGAVGPGMVTLAGANTFTGGLNVTNGTLAATFNTTANLGGGANPVVTVSGSGAVLALTSASSGFPTNNAAITLKNGETLNLLTNTTDAGYTNAVLSQPINVAGNVAVNLDFTSSYGYRGSEFELTSTTPANVTLNLSAGGSATNSPGGGWHLYGGEFEPPGELAAGSTLTILASGNAGAGLEFRYGGNANDQAMLANTDVIFSSDVIGVDIGNGGPSILQVSSLAGGANTTIHSDNNPSVLQINNGTAAGANFAGTIANGAGSNPQMSIVKSGSGLQVFSGQNTYTGSTTINGGTLQLGTGQSGQDGTIANTSGVTNNAVLAYNLFNSQSPAYVISGSGSVALLGGGPLTLNQANTYGGTTIAGGTLNASTIASGTSSLGNATTAIILGGTSGNPGTLNYTGLSTTFAPGLSINPGGGNLANNGQTLTLGGVTGNGPLTVGGSGSTTIAGAVSGITSFTAASGGVVTLAGNNTYSGSTSVFSGGLYLNGTNATASLSVAAGLTLGSSGSAPSATANVGNGAVLNFTSGNTFALAGLSFSGGCDLPRRYGGPAYLDPAIDAATLTTSSSPVDLYISNVPAGSGTMELLHSGGSIGGSAWASSNWFLPRTRAVELHAGRPGRRRPSVFVDYPYWAGSCDGTWNLTSTGN